MTAPPATGSCSCIGGQISCGLSCGTQMTTATHYRSGSHARTVTSVYGQSFTATNSGKLSAISFYVTGSNGMQFNVRLDVFAGEVSSGTALLTKNITIWGAQIPTVRTYGFTPTQTLTAGMKYTFKLTDLDGNDPPVTFAEWFTGPHYTDGRALIGSSFDDNLDMKFTVRVVDCP